MAETSRDGVLAVYPDDQNQLSLAFSSHDLGARLTERLVSDTPPHGLDIAGRSAAGQLGMDVLRASGEVIVCEDSVHVPISIQPYTPTARAIAADIGEIQSQVVSGQALEWDGKHIQFGRIVDYTKLRKLNKDDIDQAIADRLIAFDPEHHAPEEPIYNVNDDGSVSLPLSLLEFVFNEEMLQQPEQRFNALHHGRAGLIPHMDTVEKDRDDVLPEFMVGGTIFSPGPYYVKIREFLDAAGTVRQLPSAALFDGNRLMGIDPRHDSYSRNRQIEITSSGQQTFGDTWVTVEVFRPTEPTKETLHPVVDWRAMSPQERTKIHNSGVSPLDVIKAEDPTSREFLLEAVRQPETAALVISSHGISKVPRGQTSRFTAQNIREAARSFGRFRSIPEDLEPLTPFVEALKPAADRSRLVVVDELELRHIPNIVKSGDVRALLIGRYLGSGARGVAMPKEDHSGLVDLVRQGVSIAWENDGDLRELHRNGLWLTPEAADRTGKLDMVVAMYGSHFTSVGDALETQVDDFFGDLTRLIPVERLAITHGNMAGIMAIADQQAQKHGIMSLGVGLDLSAVGQNEVNMSCDGFLFLDSSERLYRQEKLDKLNTISVFNVGGYGTLEELFITVCSQKLTSRLPTPSILVAPDDLYTKAGELIAEIGNRGLGQPWVANTIHLVKTYDEATEVIKNFWNDPQAYWQRAAIPQAEILIGYQKHQAILEQMGMRLASNLREASANYSNTVA